MKNFLPNLLFLLIGCCASAQQRIIDSINHLMPTTNDTLRLVWNALLSNAYNETDYDSVLTYNRTYLALCRKLNFSLQEADAIAQTGFTIAPTNAANGIGLLSSAQRLADRPANKNILPAPYLKMLKVPSPVTSFEDYRKYVLAKTSGGFGFLYYLNNYHKNAIANFQKGLDIAVSIHAADLIALGFLGKGMAIENVDSSLYFLQKARQIALQNGFVDIQADAENFIAQDYAWKKNYPLEYFFRVSSLSKNIQYGRRIQIGWSFVGMADYYARSVKIKDSVLWYAHKAIAIAEQSHGPGIKYWAAMHLSDVYKADGNKDSAYKYLQMRLDAKEKISSDESVRQFEGIDYAMQTQQRAIEAAQEQFNNRLKTYAFLTGIAVLTLLTIIFWRNNKRKQREFTLLQQQKIKTDEALKELKATQAQLIQSEKMASLGELTAGIAHEIQNPLNFVNNFSEVNSELIQELREENKIGNPAEVETIARDIEENLQKIHHHGRRADSIVKGMLEHSRTSKGEKQPTNLSALVDEYLRLAYHGIRAKDKAFNADIQTHFDESISKVNIIPQDIGRVLLNLFNNAFYAVNEKKLRLNGTFEPRITVSTAKQNERIVLKVADNGNGIPQKVLDKIFQPFFTTKPTGQGTGLGLSLSYDIVKAHGGEIKVESKEGEGTTFIVQL